MSTNARLTKTLIDLLADPAIKRVNFSYKSIVVTGMRYSMVSEALAKGHLQCQVGVDPTVNSAGFVRKAKYDVGGVMRFRDEWYGSGDNQQQEQLYMLHEATHAMHDLFGTQTNPVVILAVDDEVVSALACALFSRLTMVQLGRPSGTTYHFAAGEVDGYEEDAIAAADRVLVFNHNTDDPRTIGVDGTITKKFRDKVAATWGLVGGRAGEMSWYTGYR
jgi:hypothetical protein